MLEKNHMNRHPWALAAAVVIFQLLVSFSVFCFFLFSSPTVVKTPCNRQRLVD